MASSEFLQPKFDVLPDDIARVEKLYQLIERGIKDPIAAASVTDPVEANMLRAFLPELFDGGRLRPHLDEVYALKRMSGSHYPPGYDLRSLEFALDKQIRRDFADYYPQAFTTTGTWQHFDVFKHIDSDELVFDMWQGLRSNYPNSYEIFKILSHIFKDRLGPSPTVFDTGTSLGLGIIKWMSDDLFPFDPISVLQAPQKGQPISPDLPGDRPAQARVDQIVSQPNTVAKAFGSDILPINPENKSLTDLVFSSTFPMGQSIDRRDEVAEFKALVESLRFKTILENMLDLKEVEDLFSAEQLLPQKELLESHSGASIIKRHIDATDPESLTQLSEFLPDGKADIFTFSGVTLQFPPEKLRDVFSNFLPYCNQGALYFVSEWANINPASPAGLEMIREDWWHKKAQFKTFIIDPFNLDQPPIEFCRYLNRQCEQIYLTPVGRSLLLGETTL